MAKFATFDGLRALLKSDGDALLACFVQPGKVAEIGDGRDIEALLESAFTRSQTMSPDDSREVRELKQIVNWIREEMIAYVDNESDKRNRKAKLRAYYQRLNQRVIEEKRIFTMTEQELLNGASDEVVAERNAKLRRLGLPTIVIDEK